MNRGFLVFLIFMSSFFLLGWTSPFSDSVKERIKEGNKLYLEEKYDEALGKYTEALAKNSTDPVLYYNMGNAFYKQKKYVEALESYAKSVGTEDLIKRSKAYYNMANSYYRLKKNKESEEYYKKALELNPDDSDARKNLEFVKSKMDKKESNKDSEDKKNDGKQDKDKKDKKEDSKQGKDKKDKKEDSKQGKSKKNKKEKGMSKEDAERMLNALKNDEKNVLQEQIERNASKMYIRKDW